MRSLCLLSLNMPLAFASRCAMILGADFESDGREPRPTGMRRLRASPVS